MINKIFFFIFIILLTGFKAKLSYHPVLISYLDAPDTHPLIPNCAYAGYHGGQKQIPETVTVREVANVKIYGAQGNGKNDDTQAILKAFDSGKPYVYFPEGDYIFTDMIRITNSRRVIFGDGPDKTRIHFKKSLSDILGPFMKTNQNYNRWSNHGGLIWIAPGDIWDPSGNYKYQLGGPEGLDIGWIGFWFCPTRRPSAKS